MDERCRGISGTLKENRQKMSANTRIHFSNLLQIRCPVWTHLKS